MYSVGLTPLFMIVADTCGKHHTIGGCCSAALNTFRYGVGYQLNCRENFLRELVKYGLGSEDMAANAHQIREADRVGRDDQSPVNVDA